MYRHPEQPCRVVLPALQEADDRRAEETAVPEKRITTTPFMLPHSSTLETIEQIAAIGGQGVNLYLGKIDSEGLTDDEVRAALDRHGIRPTCVLPHTWTILPTPAFFKGLPSEQDPHKRIDAICAALERVAAFEPLGITVAAGASGDAEQPLGPPEVVYEGVARVADAAAPLGLTVVYEMLAPRIGAPVSSFADTIDLLRTLDRPNLRLNSDVWHIWDHPDLHDNLAKVAQDLIIFDVCDIRFDERGPFDRELPGRGRDVATAMIATLLANGFDGWWKLEVFSDDGTYGQKLDGSYWELPPVEFLQRTRDAFEDCYAKAQAQLAGAA
jgi:sugar phosphate isomerase/epimerase